MHFYQHHIKDFNNATRHLTHVERALYREAIELYYDSEQPLPCDEFDRLARRLLAVTDEEKAALKGILGEFFDLTNEGYRHDQCDKEIEKYKQSLTLKAKAGKASAAARRKKSAAKKNIKPTENKQKRTSVERPPNTCATPDEQVSNRRATNHKPITNSKSEYSANAPYSLFCAEPSGSPPTVAVEGDPADPAVVITLPTNRHATGAETHSVTDADLAEYTALYPAVDVAQALRSMRGWLMGNPGRRKTLRGMPKFIHAWLAREQNRGGTHGPNAQLSAAPARRLTASEQIREDLAQQSRTPPAHAEPVAGADRDVRQPVDIGDGH